MRPPPPHFPCLNNENHRKTRKLKGKTLRGLRRIMHSKTCKSYIHKHARFQSVHIYLNYLSDENFALRTQKLMEKKKSIMHISLPGTCRHAFLLPWHFWSLKHRMLCHVLIAFSDRNWNYMWSYPRLITVHLFIYQCSEFMINGLTRVSEMISKSEWG